MSTRKTKARVLSLLRAGADWPEFDALERSALINALLASLSRPEEEIRARAAAALGRAVAGQAQEVGTEDGLEAAREVLRRLIWFLNDESGAVGWGAAEGMAEIMVRLPDLAREFSAVLVFQLRDDPGSPDFPPLVPSSLRAVGRIAEADKNYAAGTAQHLPRFLQSPDPEIRALAAWVAGLVGESSCLAELKDLAGDETRVRLFRNGEDLTLTVGEAAGEALARLAAG